MTKVKIFVETSKGKLSLLQIAEITGIDKFIIRRRYYRGVRGDELLLPLHEKRVATIIDFNGERETFRGLSERYGIPRDVIRARYAIGIRGENLIKPVTRPKNHIGEKYGMLTIIDVSGKTLKCRCDCGNICYRSLYPLIGRKSKNPNCGCSVNQYHTHLMSKTKEHKAWRHIKERCLNKRSKSYPMYGGRGITICERWKNSFENFYADMGPCPNKSYSIDRLDVNGNYEPGNCRWATFTQQMRNRRNTVLITHNGETRPLTEWAEIIGIKDNAIRHAKYQGKDLDLYLSKRESELSKKRIAL